MDSIQGVAIGGLLALGGGILSALVTLTMHRRQATGPLRLHLFEKQLEAHAAVVRQLGKVHLGTAAVLATRQLTGANSERSRQAARELNDRGLEAMRVLDELGFYLDRSAGEAALRFIDTAHRVRDNGGLTAEELGVAYGQAVATCQRVLSIPELANETFREVVGRRPRQLWRRRGRSPASPDPQPPRRAE